MADTASADVLEILQQREVLMVRPSLMLPVFPVPPVPPVSRVSLGILQ